MITWNLKQGADRRLRAGHPWVFSNELVKSPKGHSPGELVTVLDSKNQFLAQGYGNPHSLISFRALCFKPNQLENRHEFLVRKLLFAWQMRVALGLKLSFRLCFGEADSLPGLIIDRYVVEGSSGLSQVFAVQVLTAGMELLLKDLESLFQAVSEQAQQEKLSAIDWNQTAIVVRNDVQIRKLEGLEVLPAKILRNPQNLTLANIPILIESCSGSGELLMNCDLFEGQKTGFFLDQRHNIRLVSELVVRKFTQGEEIRILDLCCYVGQWGTQLGNALKEKGKKVRLTSFDASKSALEFAAINAKRVGIEAEQICGDVLKDLDQIADRSFDVVIADPPAFIKKKNDIPTGKHAYLKMNTSAFRICRSGGFVVSCSCSGLLEREDFAEAIRKAIARNSVTAQNVLSGGHAEDHPVVLTFPEGHYLKMMCHYRRS